MVNPVDDFERLCIRYQRLHGREPLHARAAREALLTEESPVSRMRHVRVAAEGTLKFVLRERGGEQLYQKVSAKRPTLDALIMEFEKNTTLRNQLRDIDGWARVEQDFKNIQLVGNRASHHQKGTVHEALQPGVYIGLERVLAWAWDESLPDDHSLEIPEWGPGRLVHGQATDCAMCRVPVEPKLIQPLAEPAGPSRKAMGLLSLVIGTLGLLFALCIGAVLLWEASGLDSAELFGNDPTMSADAPDATRTVPNRRADQPKR